MRRKRRRPRTALQHNFARRPLALGPWPFQREVTLNFNASASIWRPIGLVAQMANVPRGIDHREADRFPVHHDARIGVAKVQFAARAAATV